MSRGLSKLGTNDWFVDSYGTDLVCDSPKCSLLHAGGYLATKEIQHVGDGATTQNLFVVAGTVRLLGVYGVVTAIGGAVGTADTMNNLKLELDDGGAQADLTLADSGLTDNGTVGTALVKDAEDSVKLTVLEADQVRYHEGPVNKIFQEGVIVAKNETTTYIRANFTGDASTDITITWTVRYAPKTLISSITAV